MNYQPGQRFVAKDCPSQHATVVSSSSEKAWVTVIWTQDGTRVGEFTHTHEFFNYYVSPFDERPLKEQIEELLG